MKTAKYIIIDIETLGRRNDAAVTQVGIVIADENFDVLDSYLIQVTPDAWNTCDRTFTGETLLWWMEQKNTPISKKPTHIVHSYKYLVDKLYQIFDRYNTEDTTIWTKGSMDLFCIKDLCEYFDMNTPWEFWQPRDIRTAKEFIKEWKTFENNNHNALDDALNQLRELKANLIERIDMETKINIAAILESKPQGTKLYSLTYGDCSYQGYTGDFGIECQSQNGVQFNLDEYGKYCIEGECILFPSKEIRDWSKFSWKKGDVLVSNDSDCHIIFKGFSKNDYTTFEGKHWISVSKKRHISCLNMQNTQNYHIEDNKEVAQTYIKTIEERLGGKLNLETLEVEMQPEFKDGDIITVKLNSGAKIICIFKADVEERYYFYAYIDRGMVINNDNSFCSKTFCTPRLSTVAEKQQLFDALAKENKAWDAEKKRIVDLKPKCEFKPFDRCIWKIRNCEGSIWRASFASYVDEYGAIQMSMSIDEDLVNLIILPYNDQTKLLVGTTDEWKGGEHD